MDKANCEENKGGGNETQSKSTEINNVTSDLRWLVNQRLRSALTALVYHSSRFYNTVTETRFCPLRF